MKILQSPHRALSIIKEIGDDSSDDPDANLRLHPANRHAAKQMAQRNGAASAVTRPT
ncbi:MAG: hypothetical protein U0936_27595 [Planctomycetaceae bacterium]